MTDEKVRENLLRRAAARQGLRLEKSRRRDPRAVDFGAYFLIDGPSRKTSSWRSRVLVSPEQGWSLDEVEAFLTDEDRPRPQTKADIAELVKLLNANASQVNERLRRLSRDRDLLGLLNELEDIFKGLRDEDRPEAMFDLAHAVKSFIDLYPAAEYQPSIN